MDDILLTALSSAFLASTISALQREFDIKDMGPLHYFIGISIQRSGFGMFLSQHNKMSDCNPCLTPADTKSKRSASSRPPVFIEACRVRSSISHLPGPISIMQSNRSVYLCTIPRQPHFAALKWIIRYIKSIVHHGFHLSHSSLMLSAYFDADWVAVPTL